MSALTRDRKTDQLGTPDNADPLLLAIPVAANTLIYAGADVGTDANGYAVPGSANSVIKFWGRCERDADNRIPSAGGPGPGTAAAINVTVRQGTFFYNNGTGSNALGVADVGKPVYASDDQTANKTDNGGLWPYLGIMMPGGGPDNLRDTGSGEVAVFLGSATPYANNPLLANSSALKARGVATSLPGTFTVTSGVLLADANGALGAQDGLTYVAGQTIILPAGTVGSGTVSAANSGPWVLTDVGGASAKYAAIRPDWWANGALITPGAIINVGGEGTLFGGTDWKTWAAGTVVIGTGDPLLYPLKVAQQVTLASSTATITNVPIRSASKCGVICNLATAGGTQTSTVAYGPIVAPTPGALGTASLVIDAIASGQTKNGTADTSVINVTIING